MPRLLDRRPSRAPRKERSPARPVLLGTLSVRVDPSAERMAIETALEAGAKLILANMLTLPPYPLTVMLSREYATLPHEEDLDAVRATARRAAALGIPTELLRVSSPRPVTALIELAYDCDAGVLVFGPDRSRISRRRFAAAARTVRRDAPCLVWIAPSG
jgi:nucleotide-binding universal stress UspA family protein